MARWLPITVTAIADAISVIAFVIIGRISHDDAASLSGFGKTLWPFAVGTLVGWSICYIIGHFHTDAIGEHSGVGTRIAPEGIIIWIATVAIGMIFRAEFGQGIAVSFVIVATIFLGLFFLGWRFLWRLRVGRLH